jgi:hypothetical protein
MSEAEALLNHVAYACLALALMGALGFGLCVYLGV